MNASLQTLVFRQITKEFCLQEFIDEAERHPHLFGDVTRWSDHLVHLGYSKWNLKAIGWLRSVEDWKKHYALLIEGTTHSFHVVDVDDPAVYYFERDVPCFNPISSLRGMRCRVGPEGLTFWNCEPEVWQSWIGDRLIRELDQCSGPKNTIRIWHAFGSIMMPDPNKKVFTYEELKAYLPTLIATFGSREDLVLKFSETHTFRINIEMIPVDPMIEH